MEFLRSLLRGRFARAQVATSRNVGCFLRLARSMFSKTGNITTYIKIYFQPTENEMIIYELDAFSLMKKIVKMMLFLCDFFCLLRKVWLVCVAMFLAGVFCGCLFISLLPELKVTVR